MRFVLVALVMVWSLTAAFPTAHAKQYDVLVVMSYEENYPWVVELRKGIEASFNEQVRIHYFYLNTKKEFGNGPKRAEEAYALFSSLKPDGVIVADDDGQTMFVVPYLKDRCDTPVIFCGVNADPAVYGYPAKNVTGVLERELIKESLLFLKQLDPSVKTIGFISTDTPTTRAVESQILSEAKDYPMKYVGLRTARTMDDAMQAVKDLKTKCDALLYITMEGLQDETGKPLSDKQILSALAKTFGKPVITNGEFRVRYGALSAVSKTGVETGDLAAGMLLKAMQGTPIKDLPVTRNRFGYRLINVDTMAGLGIKPKAMLVRSATLVRTEK